MSFSPTETLVQTFTYTVCTPCGWFIASGQFPDDTSDEDDDRLVEQVDQMKYTEDDFAIQYWLERYDVQEESTKACECCNTRLLGLRATVEAVVKDVSC